MPADIALSVQHQKQLRSTDHVAFLAWQSEQVVLQPKQDLQHIIEHMRHMQQSSKIRICCWAPISIARDQETLRDCAAIDGDSSQGV
jgi:hypothetical protein